MRRFAPVLILAYCLWSTAVSNPKLDHYSETGITEVYIASPVDWYIEIDGTWCMFDFANQRMPSSANFPCSSDVYLHIERSAAIYETFRARVRFVEIEPPKNGYYVIRPGVISQASLRLTAEQKSRLGQVQLADSNVIKVTMDTSNTSPGSTTLRDEVRYWSFPLQPCPKGNSLIAIRNSSYKQEIFTTSRRSIGSPGNYTTQHRFTLIDKNGIPIQGISASEVRKYKTALDYSEPAPKALGVYNLLMGINDHDTTVYFSDPNAAHSPDAVELSSFPVRYDDKAALITKIVTIPVTQCIVSVVDSDCKPVTDIHSYKEYEPERYRQVQLWSRSTSGIEYFPLKVYPSLPVCPVCFSEGTPSYNGCLGTWHGTYIDSISIKYDTIVIPTTALLHKGDAEPPADSRVTISALFGNRREVRIVISSSLPALRGFVSLYTVNGSEVASQAVGMHRSGTSSAVFKFPAGKLLSGVYLCRLTINGYSPVSRQVTVR